MNGIDTTCSDMLAAQRRAVLQCNWLAKALVMRNHQQQTAFIEQVLEVFTIKFSEVYFIINIKCIEIVFVYKIGSHLLNS